MALAFTDPGSAAAEREVEKIVRFGALIVFAVFGGLMIWSLFFPIAGAVIASGTIQVADDQKIVQHLEGGIVKALHVKEGDLVTAGQVLIELDPTVAGANFQFLDSQLVELYARRERLASERDSAADVGLPPELKDRLNEPAVQRALGGQLSLFNDRMLGAESRTNILRQRIAELGEQIKGTEAQAASKEKQIQLLSKELTGLKALYAKGYAPLTRILALERESERLTGEAGESHAQIASLKNSIGEAESEILKDKQQYQEAILGELREVENEIGKILPQRAAAKDALHRIAIVAPASGRVINLAVHTSGGVITPATPLMTIVPQGERLVVLAQVRPVDVDKIHVGGKVRVRLSAFQQRTTPTVEGQVISVAPDRVIDERTGRAYYQAKISLPHELPAALKAKPLLPGMPADVFVRTGDRTAFDYLLSPLTDAFSRTFRED